MQEVSQLAQQVPDTFDGLFLGYTVFWAAIACYVAWLGLKLGRLGRR